MVQSARWKANTYIELNILSRAVNANPVANIDFIFT